MRGQKNEEPPREGLFQFRYGTVDAGAGAVERLLLRFGKAPLAEWLRQQLWLPPFEWVSDGVFAATPEQAVERIREKLKKVRRAGKPTTAPQIKIREEFVNLNLTRQWRVLHPRPSAEVHPIR